MLFTVSAKASSFGGFPNIGLTKTLLLSGFDQNAQINLIICKNSELMAGSQYPQTTRSLLKTELQGYYYLLYYYCFCSVDKNHHLHRRWINPFPQLLASHYLKMNRDVINSTQGTTRKLKTHIYQFESWARDPSGFWNPGK